ncbi:MAG: hypothetical protein UU67_C0001G0005 [Candidatus Daviesbacteria bacterium GW2011_GWB1_41_5]|nr:MAG: hypothetical protein UU67_C0001G0005 [Candidatus Daviesbacteria bacterium GW2011_GWB1_41_5]
MGVGFNVLAQLLLKQGMAGLDIISTNLTLFGKIKLLLFNPLFWGAILSYGAGFVIYAVVLSKINLGVAYPVASVLAIVAIYLFSLFYFNESLTTIGVAGVILCITGVALLLK